MKEGTSRFGAIILFFVVIVVMIAGIVWAGRMIFGDGGPTTETDNPGREALTNVTADSGVRMTVRGPIIADETHRSYRITIRPNSRNMTTYQGYLKTVIQSESLSNNTRAYEELSFALDGAGMMSNKPFTDEQNDTRGICPSGKLIEFEVLRGDIIVQQLWTTTCEGAKGSFDAKSTTIQKLFTDQIPGSSKMITNAKI